MSPDSTDDLLDAVLSMAVIFGIPLLAILGILATAMFLVSGELSVFVSTAKLWLVGVAIYGLVGGLLWCLVELGGKARSMWRWSA